MGIKATYTDSRSGERRSTPVFGKRELAETYVRQMKGARDIEYVESETIAAATVTAVDEGTAEKQREASKKHYAPIKAARRGTIVKDEKPAVSAEQRAELEAEVYGAALQGTGSSAAAMDEVNFVRGAGHVCKDSGDGYCGGCMADMQV